MAEEKGNFFVRRPIVAMVIAIVIVIVGGVSAIGLAIEQYPSLKSGERIPGRMP
jgi:HAE1 family hydrophobic/amphiphilic exporter-1